MLLLCEETHRAARYEEGEVQCFKTSPQAKNWTSVYPKTETPDALQIAIAWVKRGDLSDLP